MNYEQFKFEFNIDSVGSLKELMCFLRNNFIGYGDVRVGDVFNMTVSQQTTFLEVKNFYRKYKSNTTDYEQYVKSRVLKRKLGRELVVFDNKPIKRPKI